MKILIIQNAFIGDVILATAVLEKLHHTYPAAKIDFMIRKGNEGLLIDHPYLHELIVWDKSSRKYSNLFRISAQVRASGYEYVINLHRFGSSGFVTALSKGKHTFGFDKNPFSFLFTRKVKHDIGNGKHEVERNQELINEITDVHSARPRLYPSKMNFEAIERYSKPDNASSVIPYICIAPTSVWFTKQYPKEKWIELIDATQNKDLKIYLLGGPGDFADCESIKLSSKHTSIVNLAGKLTLLDSAALMKNARMNYVNDSAPMHMASAMNAPVTAIFCSTLPAFGFGPLSDQSKIVETKIKLECRPCGLHGLKACPKKHFKCALTIQVEQIL
jgi:ADP-heptose:LPS heptosyltransferase